MTTSRRGRYQNVQLLDEAVEDIRIIAERSPAVLRAISVRLKALDNGTLQPQPLSDFLKAGQLSNCGKIVIALAGEPEYRYQSAPLPGPSMFRKLWLLRIGPKISHTCWQGFVWEGSGIRYDDRMLKDGSTESARCWIQKSRDRPIQNCRGSRRTGS